MSLNRVVKSFLICCSLIAAVMWLASGSSSQSPKPGQTGTPTGDYVGSDACKDCHEDQFKAFSHTSHASSRRLELEEEKLRVANRATVPARRTWKKAIQRRSFPSRTNRQRQPLRLVLPATPAKKSTTTSGAANTGAMTSVVQIATHRTAPQWQELAGSITFIVARQTREAGLLDNQNVED